MSKPKLSDSQLVILSTAARAERAIGREDLKKLKAKGAALSQAVRGLITRGLLQEVPAGLRGPAGGKTRRAVLLATKLQQPATKPSESSRSRTNHALAPRQSKIS